MKRCVSVLATCCLLAGCGRSGPADPRIDSVVPGTVMDDVSTQITINGANFYQGLHINNDDKKPGERSDAWRVRVANLDLAADWIDLNTLEFTLPAGADDGTWTVTAVGPAGQKASRVDALTINEQEELQERLFQDPFGDGASFSFVFGMDDRVWLAPGNGAAAVSFEADGDDFRTHDFAIGADATGNTTSNLSASPYPSFGSVGCTVDTSECGPDNESGIGYLATQRVDGDEWLVIAGAKTVGDHDYVYMTRDTGQTLSFDYVDLSAVLGPQTRGFSAARSFKGRLYLGFPDTGGNRPYLVSLEQTPSAPGLDAVVGSDVVDLDGNGLPGWSVPATANVDALWSFKDLLYAANPGGIHRSLDEQPVGPGDFTECTPSDPNWTAKATYETAKFSDLVPADRGIPFFASYQDRLYMARNTVDGPQLWRCNPDTVGDSDGCDPGDWELVAPNTSGDAALTQFNDPGNQSITVLAATGSALYVGFDNPGGVTLFRTTASRPDLEDFTGQDGCAAVDYPATCAGIGGDGLGDSANIQVLDARVIRSSDVNNLYVVTGAPGIPLRLFRLLP